MSSHWALLAAGSAMLWISAAVVLAGGGGDSNWRPWSGRRVTGVIGIGGSARWVTAGARC